MSEAWKTRSGQASEAQSPQSGDDLAAMERRRQGVTKERASVVNQRQTEQEQRKQRLGRQASRNSMREWISQGWVWKSGLAALLVGLCLFLAWPTMSGLLNPSLSESDLAAAQGRLDLSAQQQLGAPTSAAVISSSEQAFVLTYTVRRGQRKFNGRRATKTCRLSLSVNRQQSASPATLSWVSSKPECF
jgi:hypothetical protein